MKKHKVNITMSGKGGIGKSVVTLLVAQDYVRKGNKTLCLDTDPQNATFASFKALGAELVQLTENGSTIINERRFDDMMEQIINADCDVIIDNGAASFAPFSAYLIENEGFAAIQESGKDIVIHSVIAGGSSQDNTMSDFVNLVEQLPEGIQVVIWLNEYYGPIEANGKSFEEMKAYLDNKEKVTSIIRLPKRTANTYGEDFATMLKKRLTFEEALNSETFRIMSKQRLKIMQRDINEQLQVAL